VFNTSLKYSRVLDHFGYR